MPDAHAFLQNLAVVLGVAALTTVVFQRLHQPVVFGYLIAGMIVGPYVPIPLAADEPTIRTLAELGVILLMFSLGLDFSLRRLFSVGATSALIAIAETSTMAWIGFGLGQLFGWSTIESVFLGAIIAISSTTIIVKAFDEQRVRGKFTDVVLGVLIMEDLIAIFLLAVLTTLSTKADVSAGSLVVTGVRLGTFLVALVGIGLLVVPRMMRAVVRMGRKETTLVAAIGICFTAALLASNFGYSVALGAFIAGSLVAESGEAKVVEHLVHPIRDMFAAIFFVAVGMLINPTLVLENWGLILVLVLVVIVGKVVAVTASAFFTGSSPRTSIQSGMSLAQIGEFSFIIATVGLTTGATRPSLYPIAVAVSAITTLTTPWLIRGAGPVAQFLDRKLPHAMQTYVSLYGSWVERIRHSPRSAERSRVKRLVRLVLFDAVLIGTVVIGATLETARLTGLLQTYTKVSGEAARFIVLAGVFAVGVPLVFGLVHTARLLGVELARKALPEAKPHHVDMAAAPRGALVVTIQLAIVLVVGLLLLAVTQPFLPPFRAALGLAGLVLILVVAFWRSAKNLEGHALAGAEVIGLALAKQMAAGGDAEHLREGMEKTHTALPGLGEPIAMRVTSEMPAAGKRLADLNLRGITGATVLAILRDNEYVAAPLGGEVVRPGDVLAIGGTHEATDAARALLTEGETSVGAGDGATPAPEQVQDPESGEPRPDSSISA
jgi:CPA2 family monovalent cation:H+ antiporter-2